MGECLIIRAGGGTDTSNATATANTVLSGYSCYANDELVIGAITPQSTNAELNPGEECAIPEGYHDGTGVISATTLSSQTSGTANASRILSGRTAWVNGNQITGSMTNRGAVNQNLSANGSYTIPSGWHSGSGKVTQSLTTQGAKSVTPTTSNQTACAANRWTTGTIVILGSSNLKAANIKNGVTIFGVKGNFTGWVDSSINAVGSVYGITLDWNQKLNTEFRVVVDDKVPIVSIGGFNSSLYEDTNLLQWFSKVRVSASGKIRFESSNGSSWMRIYLMWDYYNYTGSNTSYDSLLGLQCTSSVGTGWHSVSGESSIDFDYGYDADRPYIYNMRIRAENESSRNARVTMTSLTVEFVN